MDKLFKLTQLGTDIKTEFIAGSTLFFTIFYIVIVNPTILSAAGVPFEQVFIATIITTVVGTLMMALWGNYPMVIAPGMGMNAYFVNVVITEEVSYQAVFGAVLLAGIFYLLLTFTNYREIFISAIPDTLTYSVTAGMGIFIAIVGFRLSGIIVDHSYTLVSLGDILSPMTLFTLLTLFLMLLLISRKEKGAIILAMLIIGIIGYFIGFIEVNKVVSLPEKPVIFDVDLKGVFSNSLYSVVLTFLLIAIMNTSGTRKLIINEMNGITFRTKPKHDVTHAASSVATTIGALFGTTPATAYIESASGLRAGGRSGLTTLVVALLFALIVFFLPLFEALSTFVAITVPVLIIVGSYMFTAITKIQWNNIEEAFPAFFVIVFIPLTASISTGMAFGFIIYPLFKLFKGKYHEVHPIVYGLAVIFLLMLIFNI